MPFKLNPLTGKLDLVNTPRSPFITYGDDGILTIRFQSTVDDSVWDMTIDETGAVVTTLVPVVQEGTPVGLLLALTREL